MWKFIIFLFILKESITGHIKAVVALLVDYQLEKPARKNQLRMTTTTKSYMSIEGMPQRVMLQTVGEHLRGKSLVIQPNPEYTNLINSEVKVFPNLTVC